MKMSPGACPFEVTREARTLARSFIIFEEAVMSNKKGNEEEFRPTGTVTVLIIFLITLIVLWASVYMILLSRGVTV